MLRRTVLLLFTLAIVASHADAQMSRSIAIDATVGAGVGHGGEFYDRDLFGTRIAASIRRPDSRHVGVFGEFALDALSLSSGHAAVCYRDPHEPCLDPYPQLIGGTVTGGVFVQRDKRIEMRFGVGGGVYGTYGARITSAVSQVDVAWFPVAHVGLVAGGRGIIVPQYRGALLTIVPWAIGLRLR